MSKTERIDYEEELLRLHAIIQETQEGAQRSSEIQTDIASNAEEMAEMIVYLAKSNADNIARIMKLETQVQLLMKYQLMLLQALKEKFGVNVPVEIDNVLKVVK